MSNDPRYETLRRRAVALRRSGKSTRQIRETLGIGKRLTAELVRGEPPPEWTKRPNAKDNLRARARRLRAQGKSYSEIAAALGVSKSSCSLWLRDMPRPIDKAEQIRRSVEARRRSGRTPTGRPRGGLAAHGAATGRVTAASGDAAPQVPWPPGTPDGAGGTGAPASGRARPGASPRLPGPGPAQSVSSAIWSCWIWLVPSMISWILASRRCRCTG